MPKIIIRRALHGALPAICSATLWSGSLDAAHNVCPGAHFEIAEETLVSAKADNLNYCELFAAALTGKSKAIYLFSVAPFDAAAGIGHGVALMHVIKELGEDRYIAALAPLPKATFPLILESLRVGAAYSREFSQKRELNIIFPKVAGLLGSQATQGSVPSSATVLQSFSKVMEQPNDQTWAQFLSTCIPGVALGFESGHADESAELERLAKLGLKSGNLFAIRALVKAIACTGYGASTEWVMSFLGNEVLLEQPALLIQAIRIDRRESDLADVSMKQNAEWLGVECRQEDLSCRNSRKEYWKKKVTALKRAKVEAHDVMFRDKLIVAAERQLAE